MSARVPFPKTELLAFLEGKPETDLEDQSMISDSEFVAPAPTEKPKRFTLEDPDRDLAETVAATPDFHSLDAEHKLSILEKLVATILDTPSFREELEGRSRAFEKYRAILYGKAAEPTLEEGETMEEKKSEEREDARDGLVRVSAKLEPLDDGMGRLYFCFSMDVKVDSADQIGIWVYQYGEPSEADIAGGHEFCDILEGEWSFLGTREELSMLVKWCSSTMLKKESKEHKSKLKRLKEAAEDLL